MSVAPGFGASFDTRLDQRHSPSPTAVRCASLVERALKANGNRCAAALGVRTLTYRELKQRSGRLANFLRSAGASAARPAAMYAPVCLEWLEFDVACARSGITRLGINSRLHPAEVLEATERMDVGALITTADLFSALHDHGLGPDLPVAVVGSSGTQRPSRAGTPYEAALSLSRPTLESEPMSPGRPFHIGLTSGTTGRPKGATSCQSGRAAAAMNLQLVAGMTSETRALHFLSPSNASLAPLSVLAAGGVSHFVESADPEVLLAAASSYAITHMTAVPLVAERLVTAAQGSVGIPDSLRSLLVFGAPAPDGLLAECIDVLGPVITFAYGSTEAPMPVTALTPLHYSQPGADVQRLFASVGYPTPGWEVALRTTPGDGPGELLVRGAGQMLGYWGDREATRAAIDPEGWYATGDLAEIDDEGLVAIRGRSRDVIISGGYNVYPAEVERRLLEHEAVREAAVVGLADPTWGETVAACVVVEPQGGVTSEDLSDWIRKGLAGYKRPKRIVVAQELPRGPFGKVKVGDLRKLLEEERT